MFAFRVFLIFLLRLERISTLHFVSTNKKIRKMYRNLSVSRDIHWSTELEMSCANDWYQNNSEWETFAA